MDTDKDTDMDTLTLYVPHPDSRLRRQTDAGSAIVGESEPDNAGLILVYFEGDHYGIGMSWEEKVLHAADRMVTSYPTIARKWLPPKELVAVGRVDKATRTVVSITDQDALQAWRGQ